MSGPRVGPTVGPQLGDQLGMSRGGAVVDPLASVTRDAGSSKLVPSSAAQWDTVYTVAGLGVAWEGSIWECQEPAGNLIDSVLGVTLTLAGAGHLFRQPVPGWDRLALQTVNGTSGQKWINTTTATNPATTDTILLAYLGIPAASPAVTRCVLGKAAAYDLRYNTTGKLRPVFGASTDLVTDNRGTVIAAAMQVDNTNAVSACYTSSEKLIDTYVLPVSAALVWLGGQTALAADMQYLYFVEIKNAAARLNSTQMKSLLTTLGWAPPWAP